MLGLLWFVRLYFASLVFGFGLGILLLCFSGGWVLIAILEWFGYEFCEFFVWYLFVLFVIVVCFVFGV